MNSVRRVALMAIGVVLLAPLVAHAASPPSSTVLRLDLSGVVDPFVANYVRGGISTANAEGAQAVLLTIDTPGGLDTSMREITQAILGSHVPVIGYVAPEGARAASAGTFILMACPVAAMAPGTNVGAAHPVGVAGAIEEQKVTNDAVAYIRSLAERNGRNADWAESAVRDSVSISAGEALANNVIDVIAPDTRALLSDLDGTSVKVAGGETTTLQTSGAEVRTLSMGLGPSILHTLLSPDFAFIFFYLGIGLIIIELIHPGLSVPGVLGVLFLIAAFVTFGLLPVQIVGVVLLLASALFFLVEVKHPGLGAPAILGVITLVLGGLTLFDRSVPGAQVSPWVIVPVAGLLLLFFATAVRAMMKARRMPAPPGLERMIGREGIAQRMLAPNGVVLIDAEEWSAHAVGGNIPSGTKVRVTAIERLRVDVEPIEDRAAIAAPGSMEGRTS